MILLLKAITRGDKATANLFDTLVPVAGHVRDGKFIAPGFAHRKKAADKPAPQHQAAMDFGTPDPEPRQAAMDFDAPPAAPEPKADPPEAKPAHDLVEHVTGKGKTLRGIIRRDLDQAGAKAIDPYTFRKDGGWFIREKHLGEAAGAPRMDEGSKPQVVEPAAVQPPENAEPAEDAEAKARAANAARLRAAADKLEAEATAELNRDRLANTRKRAEQAANAIKSAEADAATARTMRNLAEAIDNGEAPALAGVRSRAEVEMLGALLRAGMRESDKGLSYAQQERIRGRQPTEEDIRNTSMPTVSLHGNVAADMAETVRGKKGYTKAAGWAYRHAQRYGRDNTGPVSPDDYPVLRELLQGLKEHSRYGNDGHYQRESLKNIDRLHRLGITSTSQLHAALRELLQVRSGARKPDPVKEAERALVGQKVGFDFFPTPKPVAARMAELAGIKPGMSVLEPSAGTGHLADAAKQAGATVDTVEISDALRNVLTAKGHNVVAHDFETFEPGRQYDAILMNPPFSNRKDGEHIQRAWEMLKPGGRLVAIAGEGIFFGSDRKAQGFRDWLDTNSAEVEKLPPNTFKGADLPAQTSANARLIVLEKPADAAPMVAHSDAPSAPALQPTLPETTPPAPTAPEGPKEGDTKTEGGSTYVLRDGRWHLQDEPEDEPEEAPAPAEADAPPQPPAPAPDAEHRRQALDGFIAERGGVDKMAHMVRTASAEDGAKLMHVMAAISGRSHDEMAAHLGLKRTVSAPRAPSDKSNAATRSSEYQYADTGHIGGARKETAAESLRRFGRIGERVRYTSIDWQQLRENPREAEAVVTKSNLFGRVDWNALREAGMEPGTAFLVDRVYASVPPKPQEGGDIEDFARALESLRDRMEKLKTPDELQALLEEIRDERDGTTLTPEESAKYASLRAAASAEFQKIRAIKAENDKRSNALNAARAKVSNLQYQQEKRLRRGWKPDPELATQLIDAKADYEHAEAAYFAHSDGNERVKVDLGGGRWTLRAPYEMEWTRLSEEIDKLKAAAMARNKAENPATRGWLALGERFNAVVDYRRHVGSDAFANHVATVKAGNVKDWSWAEKEAAAPKGVTKTSERFQLLVADGFDREGGRAVTVASTKDLKAAYNLRDVESGNWVLDDVSSAKFHVEKAAEGFADLADLLGVKDQQVSFNGRLAMAFGARGNGGKRAHRAHYDSVYRVINITKMAGGGSLAHEWIHFVDNILREAATGQPSGAEHFSSEDPRALPPGPLRDAMVPLSAALSTGNVRTTHVMTYTEREKAWAEGQMRGASMSSYSGGWRSAILQAKSPQEAHDAIQRLYQEGRFGSLTKRSKNGEMRPNRAAAEQRDLALKIALIHTGHNPDMRIEYQTGPGRSQFAHDAMLIDAQENRKDPYWSSTRELMARAFSAYIEDKMAEQGRRNDYLSWGSQNRYYVMLNQRPFPEGEERTQLNAHFDRLMAAIRDQDILSKALGLLEAA